MKYIKTYEGRGKSGAYLNEERQIEIIQAYTDCFIELSDLGTYTYAINYGLQSLDIFDNDDVVSTIKGKTGHAIYGIDKIEILTEAYSERPGIPVLQQSSLLEIYDYLRRNLKDDEMRLSEMANVDVENVYTRITVNVNPEHEFTHNDRFYKSWYNHPSIISSSFTGNQMNDYTIDIMSKPRGLVRKFKSFLHGKETYNFPELNPDDTIRSINMLHYIRGKGNA
jgi:hypothetical protein